MYWKGAARPREGKILRGFTFKRNTMQLLFEEEYSLQSMKFLEFQREQAR